MQVLLPLRIRIITLDTQDMLHISHQPVQVQVTSKCYLLKWHHQVRWTRRHLINQVTTDNIMDNIKIIRHSIKLMEEHQILFQRTRTWVATPNLGKLMTILDLLLEEEEVEWAQERDLMLEANGLDNMLWMRIKEDRLSRKLYMT